MPLYSLLMASPHHCQHPALPGKAEQVSGQVCISLVDQNAGPPQERSCETLPIIWDTTYLSDVIDIDSSSSPIRPPGSGSISLICSKESIATKALNVIPTSLCTRATLAQCSAALPNRRRISEPGLTPISADLLLHIGRSTAPGTRRAFRTLQLPISIQTLLCPGSGLCSERDTAPLPLCPALFLVLLTLPERFSLRHAPFTMVPRGRGRSQVGAASGSISCMSVRAVFLCLRLLKSKSITSSVLPRHSRWP